MKEEKEIKLEILEKDKNIEEISKILEKTFENNFDTKKHIIDRYYDFDNNIFFRNNHALRIRKKEDKTIMTYKALFYIPQRNNNPWFILEKESSFPIEKIFLKEMYGLTNIKEFSKIDYKKLNKIQEISQETNLINNITINKYQKTANIDDKYKIILDEVKDIGKFIEIEIFENSDISLKEIIKKIPLETKESRFGYTNLYAKRVLNLKIPDFKKLYKNDPEWNYFEGQKEIIEKIINKNENGQ